MNVDLWQKRGVVSLPRLWSASDSSVAGVFAALKRDPHPQDGQDEDVWPLVGTVSIITSRFPSSSIVETRETSALAGLPIGSHSEYEIIHDAAQDVVFLMESEDPNAVDIYVRSLFSGLPHPLARHPVFTHEKPGYHHRHTEVTEDAAFIFYPSLVVVWNWKNGGLVVVSHLVDM